MASKKSGNKTNMAAGTRIKVYVSILKMGYLTKVNQGSMGPLNLMVNRTVVRWFIFGVRNRVMPFLETYDNSDNWKKKRPLNSYDLSECKQITYNMGKHINNFSFCLLLPDKVLELKADNRQQMMEWVMALERTLTSLGLIQSKIDEHIYVMDPLPSPKSKEETTPKTTSSPYISEGSSTFSFPGTYSGTSQPPSPPPQLPPPPPQVLPPPPQLPPPLPPQLPPPLRSTEQPNEEDPATASTSNCASTTSPPCQDSTNRSLPPLPLRKKQPSAHTSGYSSHNLNLDLSSHQPTDIPEELKSPIYTQPSKFDVYHNPSQITQSYTPNKESPETKYSNDTSANYWSSLHELSLKRSQRLVDSVSPDGDDTYGYTCDGLTLIPGSENDPNLLSSISSPSSSSTKGSSRGCGLQKYVIQRTHETSDVNMSILSQPKGDLCKNELSDEDIQAVSSVVTSSSSSSISDSSEFIPSYPPPFKDDFVPSGPPDELDSLPLLPACLKRVSSNEKLEIDSLPELPGFINQSELPIEPVPPLSSPSSLYATPHLSRSSGIRLSVSSSDIARPLVEEDYKAPYLILSKSMTINNALSKQPQNKDESNLQEASEVNSNHFVDENSRTKEEEKKPTSSNHSNQQQSHQRHTQQQKQQHEDEIDETPPLPPPRIPMRTDRPPVVPPRPHSFSAYRRNEHPKPDFDSIFRQSSDQAVTNGSCELRRSQVEQLMEEMQKTKGLNICLSRNEMYNIAFVEHGKKIWIAGWNQKECPNLYHNLHIGDELVSLNKVTVDSVSWLKSLIKKSNQFELQLKRVPKAQVYMIKRSVEGESLGIQKDPKTGEVLYVDPHGLAGRQGMQSNPGNKSKDKCTHWTFTEINSRPVSLFAENSQIDHRLNSVGRDLSFMVQPSDFVKHLRKQLKKMHCYEDYLVG